ncbi:TPA: DUF5710 domain-containing protein [Streptococcus suis]
MTSRLFLDVPYTEKNEAKRLGAKWNKEVRKWYVDTERINYINFSKWLLKGSDEVTIAADYIYIIEGSTSCWKCHRLTTVVGLGISEHVHIYNEPDDAIIEIVKNSNYPEEEIHLSWSDKEANIPPRILRYLKNNYFVKTMYSKTLGSHCFANYCQHCDALQGNHFLFTKPNSVLSSVTFGTELRQKMSKLTIRQIPIKDYLILNWDVGICDNDFAYWKYGNIVPLSLSATATTEFASYEELYELSNQREEYSGKPNRTPKEERSVTWQPEEPIQKKGLFRKIIAVVLSCLAVIAVAPITIMSWSINFIKSMIGTFLFWIVGKVCVTIVLFLILELLDRFKLVPEGVLMSILEGYSVHVLGMSNGEIVSTFLFPYFDIEIWLIVGLAAIIATMNTFRKPNNY